MKQIVVLCEQITKIKEKVKFNEVNDQESDEDDEEKLEKIKVALESAQKKADELEVENEFDDDDDLDDSDYHEETKGLWKSNVESKCEFVFLKDLLNYLFINNLNWHNELIGTLSEDEKEKLKTSIEKSEKRNGIIKLN